MTDAEQIEILKAELATVKFLLDKNYDLFDEWQRVLLMYARGETDTPYAARKVLGSGEYWDKNNGKKWMRFRRIWRRLKEFLFE